MNSGIGLAVGDTTLSSDEYDVLESTYANNINAGKASVLVQGLNGYTGTAKITFTILPDTSEKTVTQKSAENFAKQEYFFNIYF